MNVLEAINARASIRKFKTDAVASEDIDKLLNAALRAPSAGNLQPWFFYVITSDNLKEALAGAAFGQKFISYAPVVVVACVEPEVSARIYGDRGRFLYSLQDIAAAIENIMLAAVSLGLGSCWVGAFDEIKVAQLLNINVDRRPVALIPIGYPEKVSGTTPRKPLSQVVKYLHK